MDGWREEYLFVGFEYIALEDIGLPVTGDVAEDLEVLRIVRNIEYPEERKEENDEMRKRGREAGMSRRRVQNVIRFSKYVTRSREMSRMSQYSILRFQYNLLVHLNSYILIQTSLQSEIWFPRYEEIFEILNNVKH